MSFSTVSSVGSTSLGIVGYKQKSNASNASDGRTYTFTNIRNFVSNPFDTSNKPPGILCISNNSTIVCYVYSGGTTKLCKSTDDGINFSQVTASPSIFTEKYPLAISGDGNTIFIHDPNLGCLVYSTNGGNSFNKSTFASSPQVIRNSPDLSSRYIIITNRGGDGYIYVASNNGATISSVPNMGSRRWWDVAISNDGTKIFGICDDGNIYYSIDSGTTINQMKDDNGNVATFYTGNINACIYLSNDSSKFIAIVPYMSGYTNSGKVYIWTEGSFSNNATVSYSSTAITYIYDCAISSDNNCYAFSTTQGLYYSTAGYSWKQATFPSLSSPYNIRWIWFRGNYLYAYNQSYGILYKGTY